MQTSELRKTYDEATAEQAEMLDLLIQDIAADATQNPEAYLRETIVPEGGE
jgi:predicted RNase H-like HicB family nuclease